MEAKIIDIYQEDRVIEFKIKSRNKEGDEYEVKRILEDFVWLHNDLMEKNIGIGIPELPQKPELRVSYDYGFVVYDPEKYPNSIEKIENDIKAEYLKKFEKIKEGFQLFLERVTSLFPQDENLLAFLTYQQNLQTKSQSTFGSILKKLKDSKLSFQKLKDTDMIMQERRDKVGLELQLFSEIDKKHSVVAKSNINFTLAQFGAILTAPEFFTPFLSRIRAFERALCGNFDRILVEALIQCSADLRVIKQLVWQRYYFLVHLDETCRALEFARLKGKDVTALEAETAKSREKFETVNESVKKELKLWDDARTDFLKQKMKQLAQVQVEESKGYCSYLKTALESLA